MGAHGSLVFPAGRNLKRKFSNCTWDPQRVPHPPRCYAVGKPPGSARALHRLLAISPRAVERAKLTIERFPTMSTLRRGFAMTIRLLVLLCVSVSVLGACSKGNEPQVCGMAMCSERQTCADAATSQCACRPEYTGNDCSGCARGYTSEGGKCVPVPINCKTSPGICGSHGTCVSGGFAGNDLCTCQAGYSGHTCQTCASGFQDNDRNGTCTASCASMTCPGAQTCTDTTGTAKCACTGNRTGINCDQCPSGWTLRPAENICVQTCVSSGSSCGSKKTCDTTQGICVCRPEYAGDLCDTCAAGYQDNDRNGACLASCAITPCPGTGQICSDTSGTARCACPPNRTGTNCDECASGYVLRPSDGTCVQSCAAQSCGDRRYCDETQGAPVCACQAGYTGANCSSCAAGYTSDGAGQCYQMAPAGTTLLGAGRLQNGEYLLGINTTNGTATPLRPIGSLAAQRLTTDLATHTIYSITATSGTASAVSRLNFATGTLTPVAMVQSFDVAAWGAGSLYTLGSVQPYPLKQINPSNGAVSDIGPTNITPPGQGSTGLVWESGGTLLFARPPGTNPNGADLYRIDPTTAAVTTLGPISVPGSGLQPTDNRVDLAFDAQGKLFLAARLGRSPEEIVAEHCRKLAAGLGYSGYEGAPVTSLDVGKAGIGAGMTRVLTSKQDSGKEIVAYASYGPRVVDKAYLRIETTNPETFVCISTYEETLELQYPAATARFRAIALAGSRPHLTLAVEGTVPPVTQPTLHVSIANTGGSVEQEFSAYQFSKVYTSTQWNALHLPTYVSAWDSDATAPTVLMEIDLGTRSATRVLPFPTLQLYPTIDTWAP
jgi:hypothetical protein